MKSSKKQINVNADVKELALEKLRKTEGGSSRINGNLLEILILAGGYLLGRPKK